MIVTHYSTNCCKERLQECLGKDPGKRRFGNSPHPSGALLGSHPYMEQTMFLRPRPSKVVFVVGSYCSLVRISTTEPKDELIPHPRYKPSEPGAKATQ